MKKNVSLFLGILLILVSFVSVLILDIPTFGGKVIHFDSTYKSHNVTCEGTYWDVEGANYAVLICPGYSCDRQKWRPFADLFVANGYTTMVFDYSGQGASTGTIGFDNAKTDAIPGQIGDAIETLHDLSGLPYENIILMGHSLGGRSVLRVLYDYNDPKAETMVQKSPVGNLIA
ncbi:MAG: alpha/beta fold hydrolase, partial [Spirochaetales bacterium]|nr:alpha/beta fold hydrolase [Candidatus Physcosoma equi]